MYERIFHPCGNKKSQHFSSRMNKYLLFNLLHPVGPPVAHSHHKAALEIQIARDDRSCHRAISTLDQTDDRCGPVDVIPRRRERSPTRGGQWANLFHSG